MIEIKFRVWFDGKYIHNDCHIMGEAVLLGDWLHVVPIERLNDVVVEQFTGLHDKNGKDIYLNDIVRVFDWGRHTNKLGIGIVTIDDGAIQTNPSIIEDQYDFWHKAIFEVIGNIHEN